MCVYIYIHADMHTVYTPGRSNGRETTLVGLGWAGQLCSSLLRRKYLSVEEKLFCSC